MHIYIATFSDFDQEEFEIIGVCASLEAGKKCCEQHAIPEYQRLPYIQFKGDWVTTDDGHVVEIRRAREARQYAVHKWEIEVPE